MQPADVLYDQLQPFSDGREEGRFSKLTMPGPGWR